MINILRSDFYRLSRQTSTYVILGVCLLVMTFNSASIGIILGNAAWLTDLYSALYELSAMSEDTAGLFSTLTALLGFGSDTLLAFISVNMKGDLLFFIAAFVACYISLPKSTGYLKNTASLCPRYYFFLSHFIVLLVYTFALLLLTVFANSAMSLIFFSSGTPVGDVGAFLLYSLLTFLLLLAAGTVMIIFVNLFRKGSTGVILIFVYISIGSGIVYSVIDILLSSIFGRDISAEYFTPVGALGLLTYGDSQSCLLAALVSVIYLLLAAGLEWLLEKKRDFI